MGHGERADVIIDTETLRSVLKSQYHAALAMLRETLERCPADLWSNTDHVNAFWQIAYHTLFFTHLYLQPNEAAFHPWEHHQSAVQHEDGLTGPPDPESTLPLIPSPYARADVFEYWSICDAMVDDAVDALNLHDPSSGFSWYKVSKFEHQIINLRHLQHHTAQLADRLRSTADVGIKWVGPH
ncbi:MAG TPA: DinB family protein [Pyrinomonadaceae bacterium]